MSSEAYDPSAPEGEVSARGSYVTKRDVKILVVGFTLVFLGLIPVYAIYKGNTDRSRCTANMAAISEALLQYAEQHDGRYPPIDRSEQAGSLIPSLGDTGHVYTWASDISGYMNKRANFLCPAAKDDEIVLSEDPLDSKKTIQMSYGMYAPYGGYLIGLVENPDQTVIVADTSTNGSQGSYDPKPFISSNGKVLPDGFAICWDDSDDNGDAATKWVTRLAFPSTSAGNFVAQGPARHPGHDRDGKPMPAINVLTASGARGVLGQLSAGFHIGVEHEVSPAWTLPPIIQRAR